MQHKSPWLSYTLAAVRRIENPQSAGLFSEQEALQKGMRLAVGRAGKLEEGRVIVLYFLVDLEDGIVADAKFQMFGPPFLIALADVACELVLRKNYDMARRIGADLIDKALRDKPHISALCDSEKFAVNLLLEAIDDAAEKCADIPFAESYAPPPLSSEEPQEYPGWKELSTQQKIHVIEEVIQSDIRPYIELDAGGIQVVRLVDEEEVIIAYSGSCTSCYSATGSTLNAIQQILCTKVHPSLRVVPDARLLSQGYTQTT